MSVLVQHYWLFVTLQVSTRSNKASVLAGSLNIDVYFCWRLQTEGKIHSFVGEDFEQLRAFIPISKCVSYPTKMEWNGSQQMSQCLIVPTWRRLCFSMLTGGLIEYWCWSPAIEALQADLLQPVDSGPPRINGPWSRRSAAALQHVQANWSASVSLATPWHVVALDSEVIWKVFFVCVKDHKI